MTLSFAVWQRLSVTTSGFFYLSEIVQEIQDARYFPEAEDQFPSPAFYFSQAVPEKIWAHTPTPARNQS
jgi:hypothetical protein